MFDDLVVGAGFAGATMAERLASHGGKKVIICDRRSHVGGNAYDHYDEAGILVHKYGPHIFHTNSREVYEYLSRFTEWRPYQHRVLVQERGIGTGVHYPLPLHRQPAFEQFCSLPLPVTESLSAHLISLPIQPEVVAGRVPTIVQALKDAVVSCRKW
jgi:UDP-galactopyranose mutase